MQRLKVLLLGDSISIGYRNIVRYNLQDYCKIIYPEESGKFAAYLYRMLYEWYKDLPVGEDVRFVYWNAGLWDVVRIYEENPQTEIEVYKTYIQRINLRLKKLFPKAIICFASSTPVIESRYTKDFFRYNKDIERYNAAAYEVLNGQIDYYDDLFSLVKEVGEDAYSDATHFNYGVNQKISAHICSLINEYLADDIKAIKEVHAAEYRNSQKILTDIFQKDISAPVVAWGGWKNLQRVS